MKFPGTGEIRVGGVREAIADPVASKIVNPEKRGWFDWTKEAKVYAFGSDADLDDFHEEGFGMFDPKPAKEVRNKGLKVLSVLALTLLGAMLAVGYLTGAIGNLPPLQPIIGAGTPTAAATPTAAPTVAPQYLGQVRSDMVVDIRLDPTEESNMVGILAVGGVANITGETQDGWIPIAIADLTGWVSEEEVERSEGLTFESDAESDPTSATTINGANFRTGPSVNDSIILVVPRGAEVRITGPIENGWAPAEYRGETGYLAVVNLNLH